ncbi:unnamed protein product [Lactuca saligna]|uniref:Uncharacterized protein n=1 Tax=Lactuca saligna TaxID=75948 RepID=A0AA36EBT4_LACSI|nr:unnamed protein product [Lactuca saligna]
MEELIVREFESDMLPGDDEEVLEINGVFDEEVLFVRLLSSIPWLPHPDSSHHLSYHRFYSINRPHFIRFNPPPHLDSSSFHYPRNPPPHNLFNIRLIDLQHQTNSSPPPIASLLSRDIDLVCCCSDSDQTYFRFSFKRLRFSISWQGQPDPSSRPFLSVRETNNSRQLDFWINIFLPILRNWVLSYHFFPLLCSSSHSLKYKPEKWMPHNEEKIVLAG